MSERERGAEDGPVSAAERGSGRPAENGSEEGPEAGGKQVRLPVVETGQVRPGHGVAGGVPLDDAPASTAGTSPHASRSDEPERALELDELPDGGASSGGATDSGPGPGPPGVEEGETPDGPPPAVEVSSLRLIATLAVAGAIAGLVIVLVHGWTQPAIQAHQAQVLREAIFEVLGGPERYETAFLVDGSFTVDPPPAVDTAGLERIYVGYDRGGSPVGVAVVGGEPGFQDVIRLLFGYAPGSEEVLGMKVLESKETPGLGDKIEKDSSFIREFQGVETPLEGVKSGRATGAGNEVDMITGATISSEAIVDIINHRLADLGDEIGSFWARQPVVTGARRVPSRSEGEPSTTPGVTVPAPAGARGAGGGP